MRGFAPARQEVNANNRDARSREALVSAQMAERYFYEHATRLQVLKEQPVVTNPRTPNTAHHAYFLRGYVRTNQITMQSTCGKICYQNVRIAHVNRPLKQLFPDSFFPKHHRICTAETVTNSVRLHCDSVHSSRGSRRIGEICATSTELPLRMLKLGVVQLKHRQSNGEDSR